MANFKGVRKLMEKETGCSENESYLIAKTIDMDSKIDGKFNKLSDKSLNKYVERAKIWLSSDLQSVYELVLALHNADVNK